jgi:hypothetical protein
VGKVATILLTLQTVGGALGSTRLKQGSRRTRNWAPSADRGAVGRLGLPQDALPYTTASALSITGHVYSLGAGWVIEAGQGHRRRQAGHQPPDAPRVARTSPHPG